MLDPKLPSNTKTYESANLGYKEVSPEKHIG